MKAELIRGEPRPAGDSYRVLILDDNVLQMNAIKAACQSLGQEVVTVSSIKEGMKYLLKRDHVDVVISEVFLQDESVFDFLKQLKKLPDHANIPVMLLAVDPGKIAQFFNEQIEQTAYMLGAWKFLVMPSFDIDRLMKELAAILPEKEIPKKDL